MSNLNKNRVHIIPKAYTFIKWMQQRPKQQNLRTENRKKQRRRFRSIPTCEKTSKKKFDTKSRLKYRFRCGIMWCLKATGKNLRPKIRTPVSELAAVIVFFLFVAKIVDPFGSADTSIYSSGSHGKFYRYSLDRYTQKKNRFESSKLVKIFARLFRRAGFFIVIIVRSCLWCASFIHE